MAKWTQQSRKLAIYTELGDDELILQSVSLTEELSRIHEEVGAERLTGGVFPTAARLFEQMTKSESFDEFLTLPAYELLS